MENNNKNKTEETILDLLKRITNVENINVEIVDGKLIIDPSTVGIALLSFLMTNEDIIKSLEEKLQVSEFLQYEYMRESDIAMDTLMEALTFAEEHDNEKLAYDLGRLTYPLFGFTNDGKFKRVREEK